MRVRLPATMETFEKIKASGADGSRSAVYHFSGTNEVEA